MSKVNKKINLYLITLNCKKAEAELDIAKKTQTEYIIKLIEIE